MKSSASQSGQKPTQAWVQHHRFCFSDALRRQRKDLGRSFLTWLVIAFSLVLPALLYAVLIQIEPLLEQRPEPQLNAYLSSSLSEDELSSFSSALADADGLSIEYISPEDALAALQSDIDTSSSSQFNPLPHTFVITASSAQLDELAVALRNDDRVDEIQLDREWIQRWQWLAAIGERSLLLISLILLLGAVATVGNTVGLTIVMRQHEIEVMTLVGATSTFIRRPFIYHGVISGIIGGLLSSVLLIAIVISLYTPWQQFIHSYDISAIAIPMWVWLFPIVSGLLVGAGGAAIACSRFVRY
ncbi:cell division protein FtsX [Umboniibacter marinipuniceus]|uniref:Cell division protein FtsX n=1 Tax=Umboniibacter marinipuniceus TaxID=569599 RepID=A0A3M0AAB1_9GAMM|nr:permease-like cell division protein FtsX [Umboniibacter marinipuniceus]RMA82091.1 cell division protein FtsX [Umboniibacter marinipuniceus]